MTNTKRTLAEYRNDRKLAAILAASLVSKGASTGAVPEGYRICPVDGEKCSRSECAHGNSFCLKRQRNLARYAIRADAIPHTIESAPTLSAPPSEIADTGKVRLGDGFISAEFPPLPAKVA